MQEGAEKDTLKKEKKSNETKQNINKEVNNNNGGQANETKTMNVCGRYVNYTCWRGRNCTLEHPVICDSDVYRRPCRETPCNLYHPQVCSANWCHKVCKWGVECKFRHLKNYVQGYDHEYNKRRCDSHYDHHDNHLTRSHNNYRYGDGPYNWSYDRSDGRYQNKREAHDPNRYKNRDIGNKHVYNTYKSYRNHANNHQNPQMGPSNEKYNQGTQRHQGPRINYPRDKYNQNTHFLGHQQNPTDWPTPMEAELLRTLRKFLQAGSNGWGPARG